MRIAFLIYDGFTALDAIGPYEVLSRLPGAEVVFAAETAGLKRTDIGLGVNADRAIADVANADILVIPGGPLPLGPAKSPAALDWVRRIDSGSKWTTSVCTGSLILGAAGLLKGLKATTHWMALEQLREFGAEPTTQRVVEQGKIITAAGVSSGIDMALRLAQKIAGDDVAQMLQLGIEYDPEPPFNSGSPHKAPAAIVRSVRELNWGSGASEAR